MSLNISPKRIVTHTDLDGVSCGAILSFIFGIDEIVFVEPSEIQQGKFMVEPTDIVSDLPLPGEGCLIWFDHHSQPTPPASPDYNLDTSQPSCAGYIYRTYKDKYNLSHFEHLVERVDAIDSAQYTKSDILNPDAAEQIATSLKRTEETDSFMQELVALLISLPLEEVAKHPLVQKKFQEVKDEQERFMELEKPLFIVDEKLIICDQRNRERVTGANPFKIYLEYPESEWFVYIRDSETRPDIVRMAAYANIWLDKEPKAHVGEIFSEYNGGGHKGAGGASIPRDKADSIIKNILSKLKDR